MISLLDVCTTINFPGKYYSLVDRYQSAQSQDESFFDFIDFFKEQNFTAAKDNVENFISIREQSNPDCGLNVATSYGLLEIIFVSPEFGGTFHGLAYQSAKKHSPELVRNPRYPRIEIPEQHKLYGLASDVYQLYAELKTEIDKTR